MGWTDSISALYAGSDGWREILVSRPLGRLKTLYTGTSRELKEKVPGRLDIILMMTYSTAASYGVRSARAGEWDIFALLTIPFVIDFASRAYYAIRTGIRNGPHPCHQPNIIGQIREYRESWDKGTYA